MGISKQRRLYYNTKYKSTKFGRVLTALKEHLNCRGGWGNKKGQIWVQIFEKRVYLDLKTDIGYEEVEINGVVYLKLKIKKITLVRIGEWKVPYLMQWGDFELIMGYYITEQSNLHLFLEHLQVIIKSIVKLNYSKK